MNADAEYRFAHGGGPEPRACWSNPEPEYRSVASHIHRPCALCPRRCRICDPHIHAFPPASAA